MSDNATELIYSLQYGENPEQTISGGPGNRCMALVSGREAFSTLFQYDIAVGSATALTPDDFPGKKALFTVTTATLKDQQKHLLQVYGIITSVCATKQFNICKGSTLPFWYGITIQPPLAAACFSRNRRAYTAAGLPQGNTEGLVKYVLRSTAERWGMQVEFAQAADKRLPNFVQLLQNDESDYDFMAAVMRACGLGYRIISTCDAKKKTISSVLQIVDMADSIAQFGTETVKLVHVNRNVPRRKRNLGFAQVAAGKAAFPGYADACKAKGGTKVTIPDTAQNALVGCITGNSSATVGSAFLPMHNNAAVCHGQTENTPPPAPGTPVAWDTGYGQGDTATYYATRFKVTDDGGIGIKLLTEVWAAKPYSEGNTVRGLGRCPMPVRLRDNTDTEDDTLCADLLEPQKQATPRVRSFTAEVVSPANHAGSVRNLCLVREIGSIDSTANDFWVELGSAFADNGAGIYTRPRKGNILFCRYGGDFSLPTALCSLYREGNTMPSTNTAGTSDKADTTPDSPCTLTIRNRSYNDSGDASIPDGEPEKFSRPRSVYDLRSSKIKCSQIQLVSEDNEISPNTNTRDKLGLRNASLSYSMGTMTETLLSLGTGKCTVGTTMAEPWIEFAKDVTKPKRPNFQGINIFSEQDTLQQASGCQIINAGGSITITAAMGINLRVGRCCISITEYGIEISTNWGWVNNPGADKTYHTEENREKIVASNEGFIRKLNNTLALDQRGVNLGGTAVTYMALNNATFSTLLGASFSMNNYSVTSSAPTIRNTVGANFFDTLINIGILLSSEIPEMFGQTETNDRLVDDSKKKRVAEDAMKYSMYILRHFFCQALPLIGVATSLSEIVKSFFSIKGTTLKLAPSGIQLSSDKSYVEAINNYVYTFPLSGYRAIAGQLLGAPTLKLFHKLARRFSTNQETIDSFSVNVKNITKQTINATEENRIGHAGEARLTEEHVAVNEQEAGVDDSESIVEDDDSNIDHEEAEVNEQEQFLTNSEVNAQHSAQSGVRTEREQVNTTTSAIHTNV